MMKIASINNLFHFNIIYIMFTFTRNIPIFTSLYTNNQENPLITTTIRNLFIQTSETPNEQALKFYH